MTLSPGSRIAQYEVLESIGAGGMGEVFRARDSRLDRDVAIKVMAPHVAADPEMRRRFETEARAIAALSHSSIVAIHELAVIDDVPMAVMELLKGQTLRQRLKSGAIPWRDAVAIAASVADGLAAAHARAIVHRDLKPENIFLTDDGAVKILDFGLALHRQAIAGIDADGPTIAQTAAHLVLGTIGYMSPEQVTGGRVDAKTDIFALGCVLFEMVHGRPKFGGSTPQEIIARLLHESGHHDSVVSDALIPRELNSIIARCTERLADKRFDSASDLALALRALLTGSIVGALGTAPRGGRVGRTRGKSLAVLPFVNSGADPATEYLTTGITENIINSLTQLGGLRVVPRSLVFRYQGLQADPATIGLALNARIILTGRVSQQGEYLSIQAELVDTATESQIWGDQFRPRLTELPNVQQDIAWQISEALRLKLTGAQKKKLKRRAQVDPAAYQEYLRGRHFFNAWSPDGFRRALEHFQRAIDLDPGYAPAYAGLGDTIGSMSYYGYIPPEEGFPRADAAAHKAIALDPELAEAHGTLALGNLFFLWNWDESARAFEKSIALNPSVASVRAFHAIMLASAGRHEEAIAEARTARQLDPLSPLVNMSVGWALFFAGRCEDAIAELMHTRELLNADAREEPGSVIIVALELLGRFEEAARMAATTCCFGVPLDGNKLLEAFQEGGAEGYWRERLAALDRTAPTALPLIHYSYAVVLAQLGRRNEAVQHLEALVDLHHGGPVFFAVDPALAPLAGHPGYERVLTRIGMPRSPMASAPRTAST
ncbi:MAG TPA: protein kinase [Vicinamibacterales bacterium]|nr:protein kinase [Vicinamibacterales bacterium]